LADQLDQLDGQDGLFLVRQFKGLHAALKW
jgi:hypothetical protein